MFNRIGKGLVLLHTAASLVLMTWAAATYLQLNDFGWKEPFKEWDSKESGTRIASELDKRTAALHELYRTRERAIPGIRPALDSLTETMDRFPRNHLFYAAELEKIRRGEGAIEPKSLKWTAGELVLDTPGKRIGKPAFDAPVPGIDKSLKTVREELKSIQTEIEKLIPEIQDLTNKADEITGQLIGTKDDKGNSLDIGLYEILENEKALQDKIAAEKDRITPIYVDAQRRSEAFLDRLRSMQRVLQAFDSKK